MTKGFFEPFGGRDELISKVINWILKTFASKPYQNALTYIIELGRQSADLDIAMAELVDSQEADQSDREG